MRQLFLEKGALSIKNVCEPALDDHSILVSVCYSFISSGTGLSNIINESHDLYLNSIPSKVKKIVEIITNHTFGFTTKPVKDKLYGRSLALDNSCSGIILAVGKEVKKFRVGDHVACAGIGLSNHADVVCIPENLAVRIKDESLLKSASLTAIGAIALQSIRRANLQLGESVCVFGLETLGQIALQLAKLSGCKVIGIDSNNERLTQTQKSGIKNVYNFSQDNIEQFVEIFTASRGIDCIIITPDCDQEDALQNAMKIVRKKGRIIITKNSNISLKKNFIEEKEIDILFSLSYGSNRTESFYEHKGIDFPYSYMRWTENRNMELFINLLENGQINLDFLTNDVFGLENISTAINKIQNGTSLGIVLNYLDNKENTKSTMPCLDNLNEQPKAINFKEKIKVGIVGVTEFTNSTLAPAISKLSHVQIDTIADKNIIHSLNLSKRYPGSRALNGGTKLFYNSDCNMLIISPSADVQVDEVLNLLKMGKAIFITKPFVLTFDDLNKLKSFFKDNPNSLFCMGFHRGFSPFIQKIKKTISNRYSPLMINYRINAGLIPGDQKMHNEWKPGRVIAQASHILDIFYYLTNSKPLTISVESIRPFNNNSFPTDNFNAVISFEDGSICSLSFTSMGHPNLGKERMELFFDSKSIVMDDFITLSGHGILPTFDEKVRYADLGYERLLNDFFDSVKRSKDLPINLDRITRVAQMTLTVDKLACQGGGEKDL